MAPGDVVAKIEAADGFFSMKESELFRALNRPESDEAQVVATFCAGRGRAYSEDRGGEAPLRVTFMRPRKADAATLGQQKEAPTPRARLDVSKVHMAFVVTINGGLIQGSPFTPTIDVGSELEKNLRRRLSAEELKARNILEAGDGEERDSFSPSKPPPMIVQHVREMSQQLSGDVQEFKEGNEQQADWKEENDEEYHEEGEQKIHTVQTLAKKASSRRRKAPSPAEQQQVQQHIVAPPPPVRITTTEAKTSRAIPAQDEESMLQKRLTGETPVSPWSGKSEIAAVLLRRKREVSKILKTMFGTARSHPEFSLTGDAYLRTRFLDCASFDIESMVSQFCGLRQDGRCPDDRKLADMYDIIGQMSDESVAKEQARKECGKPKSPEKPLYTIMANAVAALGTIVELQGFLQIRHKAERKLEKMQGLDCGDDDSDIVEFSDGQAETKGTSALPSSLNFDHDEMVTSMLRGEGLRQGTMDRMSQDGPVIVDENIGGMQALSRQLNMQHPKIVGGEGVGLVANTTAQTQSAPFLQGDFTVPTTVS